MKYSQEAQWNGALVEAGVVAVHSFFKDTNSLVEAHLEDGVFGTGLCDITPTFSISVPEDLLTDLVSSRAILVVVIASVPAEGTIHYFTSQTCS
jgi:hypothetical protein